MEYDNKSGIFQFNGSEEDIAFKYMWTCLMDLSFKGKVEVIFRILFNRPPDRFFDE